MPRSIRFHPLALAALLVLVCACQKPGASVSPSEPAAPTVSALPDMLSAAMIYEKYCLGQDFDGVDYKVTVDYAYGWLQESSLLESVAVKGPQSGAADALPQSGIVTYILPQSTAETLCAVFFGVNIAPNGEQYALEYDPVYDAALPYTLTGPSDLPEPENDGCYALTFVRTAPDGRVLRRVCYRFAPVVLQSAPESPLDRVYRQGDTVWQIAEVTNLSEMVIPQAQFETVHISTADELLSMAKAINAGDRSAQQKRYLLEADLDLASIPFTPIGTNRPLLQNDIRDDSPLGFNAVFDGQDHTISNLAMTLQSPESPVSPLIGGFFAVIGEGGTVQHLTLENAAVSTPVSEPPAASQVATGLLAGSCMGQVSDCHVSGKVAGSYQTGGLAGIIGNFSNRGAEASTARVTGCTATVSVAGDSELGGFVGALRGAVISDCRAGGEVVAVSKQLFGVPKAIGGFCGFSVAGQVVNCDASVYVSTKFSAEWIGAFMGCNQGAVTGSRYNLDKAPIWEAVGATPNGALYEVTPYSTNVKPITPQ